jgi:hypothetical protein
MTAINKQDVKTINKQDVKTINKQDVKTINFTLDYSIDVELTEEDLNMSSKEVENFCKNHITSIEFQDKFTAKFISVYKEILGKLK